MELHGDETFVVCRFPWGHALFPTSALDSLPRGYLVPRHCFCDSLWLCFGSLQGLESGQLLFSSTPVVGHLCLTLTPKNKEHILHLGGCPIPRDLHNALILVVYQAWYCVSLQRERERERESERKRERHAISVEGETIRYIICIHIHLCISVYTYLWSHPHRCAHMRVSSFVGYMCE
jgi:hypothetical protein